MNPFFENKVIVITGASSGIGKALAEVIATKGTQLVLAARRLEVLEGTKAICEAKGAICHNLFIDVANPDSILEFANTLKVRFNQIDVLINNAGISQRSQAEETSIEVDRRIMEVNFFGQVALTKAVWPMLVAAPRANIVLISSVVGTFGFPQRSAYSASKHALEGFFESWMLENKKTNIHFTTVSPGRIKTNISMNALKSDGSSHAVMDEGQSKGIAANVCAEKIVNGLIANKRKIYIAKGELVLVFLRKYLPFLYFFLVKKLKLT
jgi:dehydrogenase/reductase SDR family protein 7B